MRILWYSNSAWSPSGYGNQTDIFGKRLKALGHEIAYLDFYGLQGGMVTINGDVHLPAGRAPYSVDVFAADYHWWKADIGLSLMDAWVIPPETGEHMRWVAWLPVDHDPCPPGVIDSLKGAYARIAYSKFGVRMLRDKGLEAFYVPHGIETEVLEPSYGWDTRHRLGISDDRFVVGIVAANHGYPPRKCFDEQIRAFAIFAARHPEAMLYLHTSMDERDGENIWKVLGDVNLPVEQLKVVDQYQYTRGLIRRQDMKHVYGLMNVLSNVSRGEGFGVPIAEAQACGVPVIVGNYTSMPELVGGGWLVDPVSQFRDQDSYQFMPGVDGIVDAYEKAFAARGDQTIRDRARQHIVDNYDADMVTERYWKPTLKAIELMIASEGKNKKQDKAVNKAMRQLKKEARGKRKGQLNANSSTERYAPADRY